MKIPIFLIALVAMTLLVSSVSAACSTGSCTTGICKDGTQTCKGSCDDINVAIKGIPIAGIAPVNYAIGVTTSGSVSSILFKVIDLNGKVVASGTTHCPKCIAKNTCTYKGTMKTPGVYDVQVTAFKNATCCKEVMLKGAITVNTPAKCVACFTTAVSGKKVKFSPSCSTGTIKNVYWSFGDKYTSNAKNPTHVYKNAGTYNVCLTVYGSNCPNGVKICQTVTV